MPTCLFILAEGLWASGGGWELEVSSPRTPRGLLGFLIYWAGAALVPCPGVTAYTWR